MAYAREEDGDEDWVYMNPTPGLSNTTIMNIVDSDIYPSSFKLSQNSPNPFNPTTTIRYELFIDSFITLTVFDISGRKVIDLVNGYSQAGNYNIQWNAIDEYGQRMGAGLYFYSITTENISETKKMILLK